MPGVPKSLDQPVAVMAAQGASSLSGAVLAASWGRALAQAA